MCIYLCLTNMCVYQWIFYIYKNILSCQNKTVWVLDNSSYIHRCCGIWSVPHFETGPNGSTRQQVEQRGGSIRCVRRFLARWWRIVCCFYMFGCWLLWLMFTWLLLGLVVVGFTKSMFCVSGFGLLFSCWALRDHLYGPKFFWKVSKLSPVRYRFTTTIKFGVFPHWKTMAIFLCHFQGANDRKPLLVSLREFPVKRSSEAHPHSSPQANEETNRNTNGGLENPTVGGSANWEGPRKHTQL